MKLLSTFANLPSYLAKHKLYRYVFYSFLLSILLEMGTLALVASGVEKLLSWCFSKFGGQSVLWINMSGVDNLWQTLFQFGVKAILVVSVYFLVRVVNKYILLVLLSPVLSAMAERMHEISTGIAPSNGFQMFWKNLARSLMLNLRNFLLELSFTILLWGLGFVVSFFLPLFAGFVLLVFGALSFGVSAYYYGFGFADFSWEAARIARMDTIQLAKKNKVGLVFVGAVFQVLSLLPIAGVPIASVLCTAASHLGLKEN